ncbi:hypothetical protein C5167_045109 [Papaver somniferum]|uniref:Uncharacterized protein n=1 Tax=Papaver somniferum TaxID=3469 RepID=A0A4Y7LA18_PAPSO|nr:hypothetical protein C5167_045109 [Papaver somniferum]
MTTTLMSFASVGLLKKDIQFSGWKQVTFLLQLFVDNSGRQLLMAVSICTHKHKWRKWEAYADLHKKGTGWKNYILLLTPFDEELYKKLDVLSNDIFAKALVEQLRKRFIHYCSREGLPVMVATVRCEEIANEKLSHFTSDEVSMYLRFQIHRFL